MRSGRLVSRYVRVGGREIHYRVGAGRDPGGAPVVLVHGLLSGLSLQPLGELLAPHRRVLVPDLPGFGGSFLPERGLGFGELAEILTAWMEAVGAGRGHLVGNSAGCNTAIEAAVRFPELVASVVLQGLLSPGLRSPVRLLPCWALNGLREAPRGPLARQAQREITRRQGLAVLRSLLRHPVEERLPLVCQPALLLRGTRDPLFPRAWAGEALRRLPRGRLREVRGGAHTLPVTDPAALAEAVRSFLDEVSAVDDASAPTIAKLGAAA